MLISHWFMIGMRLVLFRPIKSWWENYEKLVFISDYRYRKVHSKEVFRHSISRCESSDTSDLTSLSSLANSPTAVKTSPELRRQTEIVTEATSDRAVNAKSCPELEAMVSHSGIKIPVVCEQSSPKTSRQRGRHRHTKSDPKYSISLEDNEALAVQLVWVCILQFDDSHF